MDSDILGLLLAILTFVIPVLTAILEKKRKKGKGLAEEEMSEPEQNFFEELFKEIEVDDDPYDGISSPAEVVPELEPEIVPEPEPEMIPEGVPAVVHAIEPVAFQEEQTVGEQENGQGKCLKQRLKENPKEMVIFGEILNPKFKEF